MNNHESSSNPRLAVITGAVNGIGASLAELLASQGWRLVLLNRSAERTVPLLEKLRGINNNVSCEVIETDLADHAALQESALQIIERYGAVDALFNNAGVLRDDLVISPMGNEMHFEINTVAPYLLTHTLRKALKSAAGSDRRAVVVTPSTSAIKSIKHFDIATLRKGARGGLFGAYAQSKLAWAVLNTHLAESFGEDGVELFAVDPGANRTGMTAGVGAPLPVRLLWRLLPKPAAGAKRLAAILGDEWRGKSGALVMGGKVRPIPAGGMNDQYIVDLLAKMHDAIPQADEFQGLIERNTDGGEHSRPDSIEDKP